LCSVLRRRFRPSYRSVLESYEHFCSRFHAGTVVVYVEPRQDFERWIQEQSRRAQAGDTVVVGQKIFETTSCMNCHNVAGTAANGRFGPDLTHLITGKAALRARIG
jgi:cytochrome c2